MDPYDKTRARLHQNERMIVAARGRPRENSFGPGGRREYDRQPSAIAAIRPFKAAGADKDDEKDFTMTTLPLDEALIERLIEERIDARRARDFAKADEIRRTLDGMGLIIIDGKDEATGAFWTTWDVRREPTDEEDSGPKDAER